MRLHLIREEFLESLLCLARQDHGAAARRKPGGRDRPDPGSAQRPRTARPGEGASRRSAGAKVARRRCRRHRKPAGALRAQAAPVAMSVTSFASLGLSEPLLHACAEAGYASPTAIQIEAIPLLLRGQDLLGLAPTGSGKTAAFALPLLQRVIADRQHAYRRVRALVLVPTRELAAQVGQTFRRLGTSCPRALKVAVLYGGVSVNPQMMALRGGADVVVATPGRLLDLLDKQCGATRRCRSAGARRGRPPAGPGLCSRTRTCAGCAAGPPAEPAVLRDFPAGGAGAGRLACCASQCASTPPPSHASNPRSSSARSRWTHRAAPSCCVIW